MTELLECTCIPHDQIYYGGHNPKCPLVAKPCTIASKPETELSKALKIIEKLPVRDNRKIASKQQDAKTYPLAFEAGKKEQEEKDKWRIKELEIQADVLEATISGLRTTVDVIQGDVAEAKKEGMREMAEWLNDFCSDHVTAADSPRKHLYCDMCCQAKLKELGL